ncbi:SDR family oxidoreductase [Sphingomonas sp. BIUV-7]|uniref:SDR family oxidoreductase n=1 Tax=Sphingomonas natans TaxID=3063330 RepID=A0ABT8YCW6_9SPHN|nr:SDR family oxidoreductase [Sphingomonas sp. BIUV-7]MDO6416177.1 SDR family oxidoreductase [Sphingomonas sp. BIUV-7]
MRILITGNMGYVGPVVVAHLHETMPDAELIGYDTGFYAANLINARPLPEHVLARQEFGDIRDLPARLLSGVDAIVHLAAISNDPMGQRFEDETIEINQSASVRLAQLAADAGVGSFVFASSCSIYGFAEGEPRREEDDLNPLTAYARSKVGTERALARLDNAAGMTITCLRFATACGASPRLRLDLVLNDFVASALLNGEIKVLSDGTPWRPLIDVADMARAVEWAVLRRPERGGRFLAVNTGSDSSNRQVATLARAVADIVTHTTISINSDAPPDKRSYQVDFGLFRALAPNHQPRVDLSVSIAALLTDLIASRLPEPVLRATTVRLRNLEEHLDTGRIGDDLRWRSRAQLETMDARLAVQ